MFIYSFFQFSVWKCIRQRNRRNIQYMVGDVYDGKYDTTIPAFTPTYQRFKSIAISHATEASEIVLMTRSPKLVATDIIHWHLITSFHFKVWLAFVSTIALISL